MTDKRFESLKVAELRVELKKYDLPVGGTKKELIARLKKHLKKLEEEKVDEVGSVLECCHAPSMEPITFGTVFLNDNN